MLQFAKVTSWLVALCVWSWLVIGFQAWLHLLPMPTFAPWMLIAALVAAVSSAALTCVALPVWLLYIAVRIARSAWQH